MTGGKLTTYRAMAADVFRTAQQALGARDLETALALTAWLVQVCPDAAPAHYLRFAALSAGGHPLPFPAGALPATTRPNR